MALLCYALLLAAAIVDFLTPQLFIAAILFNGPIALSSLTLRTRLTTNLVIVSEIANALAGFENGVLAGHHWDPIAIADRVLLAASFVLVGYLSVRTQEYAREAGLSAGRMRQVEIEKTLRSAIAQVRETLNVELVQRAVVRETVALLDAANALLIVRETPFGAPLMLTCVAGEKDIRVERRPLSMEWASLAARVAEADQVVRVTADDALGRLTLESFGASELLAAPIADESKTAYVLIVATQNGKLFDGDATATLQLFSEQAAMALEQARLFSELGERNEEIARQKDALTDRSDVIRDIVYALAHDLRTPLAAAHVTMNQALAGAYGPLPERYESMLRIAQAANHDQRRIVETLLLVARYEAGEISNVRDRVALDELAEGIVEELQPVAEVKGVTLTTEFSARPLIALGDPHELRRAIVNLVANAIDATPRNGHVVVRGARMADTVVVTVEDDGYGVLPERRDTLFQRFGGTQAGGTGLGLYIVRRIVEKHGGSVSYSPREPRGSSFTISLPYPEV